MGFYRKLRIFKTGALFMKQGLLEYLADKTGCMYLSDLRFTDNPKKLSKYINKIDAKEYSLHEWNDAVN